MTEAPSVPDSRKRLRFVGIFAIYAVVTTLMAPLFFIFGPFFPRFYYPYAQSWTQMFIELCGAKVRIHGLDRPDWERPAVLVSNHLSYLDFALLMALSPVQIHFIAMKSLRFVPFVGAAMRCMQMIFIDRRSPTRAYESIELAVQRIADGRHVLSFPEGGLSRDGQVGRFKKGLFRLAIMAQVPVIPVVLRNTHNVMDNVNKKAWPGEVEVEFLDPIETADYGEANLQALIDLTRERIVAAYGDGSLAGVGYELYKAH